VAGALTGLLLARCAAAAPALQPLPAIGLAGMEPEVRQQVAIAQQVATKAYREAGTTAADNFGEAGKVFLIYLLTDAATACFENAVSLAPHDPRWAYFAGVVAQNRGDLDRAREHLRRAAAPAAQNPAALCRLGDVELLRGDLVAAETAYRSAASLPEASAAGHFGLGRVALARGDPAVAAQQFEAALAAQPEASSVHALLATAYRRLGRSQDATAQAAAYGNRPVQFADPLMAAAAAANTGRMVRMRTALKALNEGRFAEAEAGFRQAVELDPSDALAWVNLGTAQEELGKTDFAMGSYRHAVELAPDNARAHYNLGTLLAAHGSRGEGIEQLAVAVKLRPAMADARFNLAAALAQEGRFPEALAQCQQLLAIADHDAQATALCQQIANQHGGGPPPPP
jgi:tetratricopeptide (TPR) repeat protein